MAPNLQANETSLNKTAFQELVLSILIPFEPKITSKTKIEAVIRRLTDQAQEQLSQQLQKNEVKQIMAQLNALLSGLDYSTHKKSLAVMATPYGGKIYYWNLPVHETIIISNEFPVRQLAARKRQDKEYLLLAMGDHFGGIYLGNGPRLSRLVANSPARESGVNKQSDESPAENAITRSVRHIDNALSILLRSYRYPVFVIAPGAYLQCFKQISGNASHAAALIEANPHGNDSRLQQLMTSYLADWQTMKEKALIQQLDVSLQNGKVAVGITEVWAAASEKRGRILVVEEDYNFPAYLDQKNGVLYADAIPLNKATLEVSDAVAVAMEKVLADGGIVEVVRKGTLADFLHVALVVY